MLFNLLELDRKQAAVASSSACTNHLLQLQRELPALPFAGFSSWVDVRLWLDDGGIWREETDPLLRPVLAAYQQRPDQAWNDILLFLFWRPLARIHCMLVSLEPDPQCRYSQIFWAFVYALQRIDLTQRRSRLGTKILQDVWHDARLFFTKDRAESRRTDLLADRIGPDDDDEAWGACLGGAEDPAFLAVEFEHDRAWAIARLKSLVRAGQISRADCLILVGCHLYGRTIEEMAARLGLQYQAAKKRRLRAVGLLKEIAPELSPDLADTPLMSLRRATRRKGKGHDDDV